MGGLAIISSRFYFFSPLLLSSLSLFFFSFLFFSLLFVYIHIFPLLTHNNNNHHLINMSHQHDDDDFGPSENSNYKVGQKKSLNDYQNLDADDEALRRWKESLGVASTGVSKLDDPHNVVVLQLALEVTGRPDVILDLTKSEEELKKHSFTIKEGIEYRLKVLFKVQHEVVSGLKYMHIIKRHGVKVDKAEEMIGSYAANANVLEKKFAVEEAPSGMLARGHYEVKSKFIDDDKTTHKEWSWSFDIKKDW
ncbi:MAG: immunoglobulin E-set [Linnemannia elongata]|nr:MAG: immunoglobulin E-set [Linnemannia elongata]